MARLAQIETERTRSGSGSCTAIRTESRRNCWTPSPSTPALVKYIDMPLQHASPNVLKRMKRGSHGDFFLKLLERIRATIPGVAIRTSMIVGFPGETEADFRDPVRFRESRAIRPAGRLLVFR